eukprot:TRINITY_DN2702_c1_g1_i2.p1 TRINITY_DN2702_c1_g1~~TRINITY_DN2702_c1_g1_i2.p1  ORF type:complete len:386 (+),score=89.64 TRINITY_DN2702_c1_g1_i2:219-1376(+)
MALFNVQFISTIATVFFVSRIASFVSLPHRLLAGLEYCLVPTDTTPKNASGTKASGGKRKREAEKKSMVVLRVTTLQSHALDEHFFFEELNTLLCALVSGYAMIAFGNVLQCAMHGVRAQSTTPANDMSFIALAIIAIYCLKVMLSSLAHTGSESYEMRLSILCGIVGAAVCLFVIESASFLLDFPFSAAFAEVCASWDVYASTHPMLTTVLGERVRIQWLYPWYRALLAFLGGLIASLLFFPAFRQARCHHLLQSDSSNIKANTFFTNLLSSLNFLFPLVLAILWIKPLSRDLYTIDASSSLSLKEGQFSALRLWLVVGMCLLRLKLIFPYVQVFVLQSVQYAEMIMDSNKRDVLPKIQRKVLCHSICFPLAILCKCTMIEILV